MQSSSLHFKTEPQDCFETISFFVKTCWIVAVLENKEKFFFLKLSSLFNSSKISAYL